MNTMLNTSHSWAVTMRNIAWSLDKLGHAVSADSTNGTNEINPAFKKFFSKYYDKFDLDICYTLPLNFNKRFLKNSGTKAVIYNYESSIVPEEWLSYTKHVDYIFPSSNFCKDIFIKNGWPEEKCFVVPLGVNKELFYNKQRCKFTTDKRFKFLNVSIPHYRKNIKLLVRAYYEAFTDRDDVCLIIKSSMKEPKHKFECSLRNEIVSAQKESGKNKFPQVEVVTKKFESMIPLYNECDALVSATSSEGFGLPFLEAMAAEKLVIAPNATGQIDFLNKNNSLLIRCDEIEASERYQYWRGSAGAVTYMPDREDLSEAMYNSYKNYKDIMKKLSGNMISTVNQYTWENTANKILELL